MSKGRGRGRKNNRGAKVDDDRFHDAVDPGARDFIYDEVDEYYEKQEREGLQKINKLMKKRPEKTRNEILAIASSSEDENSAPKQKKRKAKKKPIFEAEPLPALDSDLEEGKAKDGDEEDDISRDWGKKRSMYYNTDYVDEDWNDADASDAEIAEREEEEALAIQERLAQQLQDDDFGLEFITQLRESEKPKEVKPKEEEKVPLELASLSKREKRDLLASESPELLELIEDFKAQLTEVKDRLEPLVQLIRENILPRTSGTQYVEAKYRLILNYCTQIGYYFQLKSKRISVQNHPVIKRLVQFRGLLHQLNVGGDDAEAEIDEILLKIRSGEQIQAEDFHPAPKTAALPHKKLGILKKLHQKDSALIPEPSENEKKKKKPNTKDTESLTRDEQEAIELYQAISSAKKAKKPSKPAAVDDTGASEDEDDADRIQGASAKDEEEEETGKRAINYQIAKNKGLTPHRSKEQRNPRVKHRNKFRKAKIRRKGQVREARKELKRYDGEISGIKATVVRSVKIK